METPMDMEPKLRAIVQRKLKEERAFDGSTLLTETGLDSLDMIEIAFDVEDEFKIQLPPLTGRTTSATYGDLCHAVEAQLALLARVPSEPSPSTL